LISFAADEEFEDLCFEYGLELEIGTGDDMAMARIDAAGNNVDMKNTTCYKIEVPANRYDLLCLEGIAMALRCYIHSDKLPTFTVTKPEKMEKITVMKETAPIRKYVTSCILRNIQFDVQSYNSFIDL
jgi:phenylalanyl-tRNA synthetase beta chain